MDLQFNEKTWTDFLSSIGANTSSKNNLKIKTESKSECLATIFANKRHKIDSEKQPETPITKENKSLGETEDESTEESTEESPEEIPEESTEESPEEIPEESPEESTEESPEESTEESPEESPEESHASNDDNEGETPAGDSMNGSSKKTKIEMTGTPSSLCTISRIAKYLNFNEFVVKIKMPTRSFHFLDNINKMVQKDIRRLLKVVRGNDLEGTKRDSYSALLKQLIPITSIETGSRLVIDALLVPLCSVLGLQLEVEKTIKHKHLPHCRYDYCIRKGTRIIGCIEAKTVNTLNKTSIAQAILQLFSLQETLKQTETLEFNISEFPLFAIVTDGHRFIYLQLTGSSLGFEHYRGKVRIRKVTDFVHFKDIIQHIIFLVDEAVDSDF